MSTPDFTTTLLVDQSPEEVFAAINNVRGWWSEEVEGSTEHLGDEFIYRHKDMHYSKQRLIEVSQNKRVVWLVTDSFLSFLSAKSEWTDTKISFDIAVRDAQTLIRFTHQGLTPGIECFDACSNGWGYYLQHSLLNLITTGTGQPDTKANDTKTKSSAAR